MKKITLILLLASLPCVGQTKSDHTLGQHNGRFWNNLSADSKLCYLMGFDDGFSLGHNAGSLSALDRALPWTKQNMTSASEFSKPGIGMKSRMRAPISLAQRPVRNPRAALSVPKRT